jgi:hypothetical protein
MTSPAPSNPKTFKERDRWICRILAMKVPHAAARLATRIAMHVNIKTGRCDPSVKTLAAESSIPERSVYRSVDLLEQVGLIAINRSNGRQSNRYVLLLNTAKAESVLTPDLVTGPPLSKRAATPDTTYNPTLPYAGRQKAKRTAKRTAEKKDSLAPEFFIGDSKEEDSRRKKSLRKKAQASPAESFERFWDVYPRRVAKVAAERAFAKAIEGGADPETLIAGAQRYAAERAGQEPRYTKHPATWLNAGCWEDEFPAGAVIDQDGNVVGVAQVQEDESQGVYERAEEMIETLAAALGPDSWWAGGTK